MRTEEELLSHREYLNSEASKYKKWIQQDIDNKIYWDLPRYNTRLTRVLSELNMINYILGNEYDAYLY